MRQQKSFYRDVLREGEGRTEDSETKTEELSEALSERLEAT